MLFMQSRKYAIFIALDLALLLLILLLLAYYGMSHLMLMLLGLLFLVITLYDLRSGNLSLFFSQFMGLPDPGDLGKIRFLPLILSALLLILSLPVFLEHGLVNEAQRFSMQQGQFFRVAIPAILGGLAVIAVAVWTLYRGNRDDF
jgi:hypothetical protein